MSNQNEELEVSEGRGTKKAKTMTAEDMAKVTLSTKEALDRERKVQIIIPKHENPKMPNYETVQINGYTYQIQRGVPVQVPQTVFDILMESNVFQSR